jgi:O-antigen biosynthesis protein WbqV
MNAPKAFAQRLRHHLIPLAVMAHDVLMAAAAMEVALYLRYELTGAPITFLSYWQATAVFAGVAGCVFAAKGLHRGIWRYMGLSDLIAIAQAAMFTVLLSLPVLFFATRLAQFPRSVVLIVGPVLILLLALPRLLCRLWMSGSFASLAVRDNPRRVPILIAGVSREASRFIRDTQAEHAARFSVVGLIDPYPEHAGRDVRGVRVLGTPEDIERVFNQLAEQGRRPQKIVIAPSALPGATVRHLLDAAERLSVGLARLPRMTELTHAVHAGGSLEPIDLTDLLGRPQKRLNRESMRKLVAGRRVLVTGAGGTIGGELCRQIAALGPRHLTLVDNGEFALYQIDLELAESAPTVPREAILADVCDRVAVMRILRNSRPEMVFHAAALKHVPLVEANPTEGVQTNVGGTRNVADAVVESGVATMVLISTDKAVHPTSVMGASKRVAELYCQALNVARGDASAPRFVTVRFGNVLGSTGSVVPRFQRQLAQGGPLTVTHPEVSRYFMTTREAVELVLEAAALPADGSPGEIFVLDMGDPVLIADLARQMIRLAGLRPDVDVDIVYTGLRPGEKLHERLFHEAEPLVRTAAEGILLAEPRTLPLETLRPMLDRLIAAARARDEATVFHLLRTLVPEYASEAEPSPVVVELLPARMRSAS